MLKMRIDKYVSSYKHRSTGMRHKKGSAFVDAFDKAFGLDAIEEK